MAQFILGSYTFRTKGDAVKSVQHVLHKCAGGRAARPALTSSLSAR